jgi:hypothetical protein
LAIAENDLAAARAFLAAALRDARGKEARRLTERLAALR